MICYCFTHFQKLWLGIIPLKSVNVFMYPLNVSLYVSFHRVYSVQRCCCIGGLFAMTKRQQNSSEGASFILLEKLTPHVLGSEAKRKSSLLGVFLQIANISARYFPASSPFVMLRGSPMVQPSASFSNAAGESISPNFGFGSTFTFTFPVGSGVVFMFWCFRNHGKFSKWRLPD